jgi:hypothetical protein
VLAFDLPSLPAFILVDLPTSRALYPLAAAFLAVSVRRIVLDRLLAHETNDVLLERLLASRTDARIFVFTDARILVFGVLVREHVSHGTVATFYLIV